MNAGRERPSEVVQSYCKERPNPAVPQVSTNRQKLIKCWMSENAFSWEYKGIVSQDLLQQILKNEENRGKFFNKKLCEIQRLLRQCNKSKSKKSKSKKILYKSLFKNYTKG
jgi:hypothetical protein